MGTNDDGGSPSVRVPECCMCGDYGLSSELFRCKACRLRLQHKYCSNQYPKAESYNICNWCLISEKDGKKRERKIATTSPDSSSISHKNKRVLGDNHVYGGGLKDINITRSNQMICKKQNKFLMVDRSGLAAGKKSIASDRGGIGDNRVIRRTRSEEISNSSGIIIKHVFRNKVRRYKLLDDVSS